MKNCTFVGTRSTRESGFTLVELMIVVAIIGILAAIAIPNYQKYQAKSRSTEGKMYLASLYTAQKSYAVEYSSYSGCLQATGFAPEMGTAGNASQRYYAVGVATMPATTTAGPQGTATPDGTGWGNGAATCAAQAGTGALGVPDFTQNNATYWEANAKALTGAPAGILAAAADLTAANTTISQSAFTMSAAGQVSTAQNVKDTWTINEGKVLTQTTVGY